MSAWPSFSQVTGDPERVGTAAERLAAVRQARRPALFFCNAFGDHLCARPTVLSLQESLGGRLGFIGHPGMGQRFFPDAQLRFVHDMPFVSQPDLSHGFALADVMAVEDQFDALISLNPWDSPQVRALAAHIAPRPFIGLNYIYADVAPLTPRENIVDHSFKLAQLFDHTAAVERFASVQPVGPLAKHRAEHIRAQLPRCRLLTVHTDTHHYKQWDVARFREVIEAFLDTHPDVIVAVVDPSDRELDIGRHAERIFSFDQVDVDTCTDIVASSDFFLGIDSYFMHVADVARVPLVAIFGSTSPVLWGPRFASHRVCQADAVLDVSVASVLAALHSIAQGVPMARSAAAAG